MKPTTDISPELKPENHKTQARKVSPFSSFMKCGLALVAIICVVIAGLHFAGVIPIHRIPRILSAPFRRAESPDIANAKKFKRPYFAVTYPANWQLDTANANYDADHFIIIDAPRHGQLRIQVGPAETPAKDAVEQIAARFNMPGLKIDSRTQFGSWGRYEGHGVSLDGRKLDEPFQVRIFGCGESTTEFIVWEYRWDGPNGTNSAGYNLVEKTFVLTK